MKLTYNTAPRWQYHKGSWSRNTGKKDRWKQAALTFASHIEIQLAIGIIQEHGLDNRDIHDTVVAWDVPCGIKKKKNHP